MRGRILSATGGVLWYSRYIWINTTHAFPPIKWKCQIDHCSCIRRMRTSAIQQKKFVEKYRRMRRNSQRTLKHPGNYPGNSRRKNTLKDNRKYTSRKTRFRQMRIKRKSRNRPGRREEIERRSSQRAAVCSQKSARNGIWAFTDFGNFYRNKESSNAQTQLVK